MAAVFAKKREEGRRAKMPEGPTYSVHVGLDTIKVRSQYLARLLESPCKGNVTRHEDGRYTVRIHKYSYEALLAYGQYLHEDRVDCRRAARKHAIAIAASSGLHDRQIVLFSTKPQLLIS
ncbi:unnamed protein product [Symbiodinium natans]|uniref:Uncharacterized protein n=1 Tax=Symbiodinium natans TaxID=878477 RepID=A0A812I1B0_9DINO|nr:unnamed protein product [Symbiodinium natans]